MVLSVDFIMIRGPKGVSRRLRLRVPDDGTAITLGRAPHCAIMLDPRLVFASQVQCNLFCVASASSTPQDQQLQQPTESTGAGGSADDTVTPQRRPFTQRSTSDKYKLYITDMCSSNGTYINGARIGITDPTLLKHGDTCIMGGMRDIPVGGALPEDAFKGPELVVWRVCIKDDGGNAAADSAEDFAYEATPLVLPVDEMFSREEKALLETACRSMKRRREEEKPQLPEVSQTAAAAEEPAERGRVLALEGTEAVGNTTRTTAEMLRDISEKVEGNQEKEEEGDAQNNAEQQQPTGTLQTPSPQPSDQQQQQQRCVQEDEVEMGEEAAEASPCVLQQLFPEVGAELSTPATAARRHSISDRRDGTSLEALADALLDLNGTAAAAEAEEEERAPRATVELCMSAVSGGTPEATSTRRSGTVAARLSQCGHSGLTGTVQQQRYPQPQNPPRPAFFFGVRVGAHTFHVPEAMLLATYNASWKELQEKREMLGKTEAEETGEDEAEAPTKVPAKRAAADGRDRKTSAAAKKQQKMRLEAEEAEKKKKAAAAARARAEAEACALPAAPVHALTFTPTHWSWVMDDPNRSAAAGAASATSATALGSRFQCLLPISSVASLLVCTERLGIAVELKDGCQLPRVNVEVLSGGPENHWLVWLLEEVHTRVDAVAAAQEAKGEEGQPPKKKKKGAIARAEQKQKASKKAEKEEGGGSAAHEDGAVEDDSDLSAIERFNALVLQLESFYCLDKFPVPLAVDAATFDRLFAPSEFVE